MNEVNWTTNRQKRAEALALCLTVGHSWTDPPDPTNGARHCRRPGCLATLPAAEPFDWHGYRWRLATEPFDGRRPR